MKVVYFPPKEDQVPSFSKGDLGGMSILRYCYLNIINDMVANRHNIESKQLTII